MAVTNGVPSLDGEITLYKTTKAGTAAHAADILYYVNGMNTKPEEHARVAAMFADLFQHDFSGIYNLTGNDTTQSLDFAAKRIESDPRFPQAIRWAARQVDTINGIATFLADIEQCAEDYLLQTAAKGAGFIAEHVMNAEAAIVRRVLQSTWLREQLAGLVLECGNVATLRLFKELTRCAKPGITLRIVCHSQGNLITSNALAALDWVRKNNSTGNLFVYALAFPAPASNWPHRRGLDISMYTNLNDPVTWLSLGGSSTGANDGIKRTLFTQENKGSMDAHSVYVYEKLADFQRDVKADMGIP